MKCHPAQRGLPRDAAKMIPTLEEVEDMAMVISWTKEMLQMVLMLLEDAKDELRGPRWRGGGR